ncbi:hypothetical protein LXL04_023787 [Taraxacum kok-saghyz]
MNALRRIHRKFRQSNDEQTRNVSMGKSSCSCFSSLWGIHEQKTYNEEVNEKETVDMSPEFFQTFLSIGTLGSISSIPEESIIAMQTDALAPENEPQSLHKLQKNNEKGNVFTLNDKEIKGVDTKVKKSTTMCPPKEFSEMPGTKEQKRKQKHMPTANILEKSEAHALHFMKKMIKKFDFTSRCSPRVAYICDSIEKKPTKVFRKSRKIHPETANIHVTNSHISEIMQTTYNEVNNKHKQAIIKKKMVTLYPTGENAHWITTDVDYFVLEF